MKTWRGHQARVCGGMIVHDPTDSFPSNCTVIPDGEEMPLSYNNRRLMRIALLALAEYATKDKHKPFTASRVASILALEKACERYLKKHPKLPRLR